MIKISSLLLFFLCINIKIYAQFEYAVTFCGADISGAGISCQLTAGEIAMNTISTSGLSLAMHVTQPAADIESSIDRIHSEVGIIAYYDNTKENLFIVVDKEFNEKWMCEMYNLKGMLLHQAVSDTREYTIPANGLASGVYLLKIEIGHESKIIKVVK